LPRWRDAGVALSLANLCFLPAWYILLNPGHYSYYHWQNNPGYTEFIALAADILGLAIIFWLSVVLLRVFKSPRWEKLGRWAFLAILTIPFTAIFHEHAASTWLYKHKLLGGLSVVLLLLLLWLIIRRTALIARIAYTGVLVLLPFVVVNFSSALWLRWKHAPDAEKFLDRAAPPMKQSKRGPHVLWILFDEMDQRATFEIRPQGVELPELDRLRGESVFSERAYPPAGVTLVSAPALITGRLVASATPVNPRELQLGFADHTDQDWGTVSTVFSAAREAGFKTALVGWYHPYCRVLGATLDFCKWEPTVFQGNPVRGEVNLLGSMSEWARNALYGIPFTFRILRPRYDRVKRLEHIDDYTSLLQSARGIWADPELSLTLLHFPVPHHPWIYDRQKQALSAESDSTYFDNLVLVDQTLGELRRSLQDANMWESSILLVSSDHWWRDAPTVNGRRDHRVPFILKMPGQREGRVFSREFNTVITHDLLLAILKSEVSNADEALRWLERQHSTGESEFTKDLP